MKYGLRKKLIHRGKLKRWEIRLSYATVSPRVREGAVQGIFVLQRSRCSEERKAGRHEVTLRWGKKYVA